MDAKKYNTIVRQAISDKYVEAAKYKKYLVKELEKVVEILSDEQSKRNMSYKEYESKLKQKDALRDRISVVNIQIGIWDEAREICLNIADEMRNDKKLLESNE